MRWQPAVLAALGVAAIAAFVCFGGGPAHDDAADGVASANERQTPPAAREVATPDVTRDPEPAAERREAAPIATHATPVRRPRDGATIRASGRVLDTRGLPIANARVRLFAGAEEAESLDPEHVQAATFTNGAGAFECATKHPFDRGRLVVAPRDRPELTTGWITFPARDLELICPQGGRIRGSIDRGHRCRIANLRLTTIGADNALSSFQSIDVDDGGEFTSDRLAAGYQSVVVVGNGFELMRLPDVVVVDGQDTFDARLQQIHLETLTRNVQFELQDADGHPIEDAEFGDSIGDTAGIAAKEMTPGRYRFRVPIGGASVTVRARGWREHVETAVREDRVVTLQRAFSLKFVLRSRPNLWPQSVRLWLSRGPAMESRWSAEEQFSRDGTVHLFVDEPGEYQALLGRVGPQPDDATPPAPLSIQVQNRVDEQVFELDAP